MSTKKIRCHWAESDPLMQTYHDEEWGVPDFDSRSLWETLMLEGFQAGLAWIIVLRKRDAFRKAFHNFDPKAVSRMSEKDIARLLENPGIIRARAKIEATIGGARAYLDMQSGGLSFSDFAWNFVEGKPIQSVGPLQATTPLALTVSKELKRRGFKFVGPTIVYAWMQAVGLVNDHAENCFRRNSFKTASLKNRVPARKQGSAL
jgi:DNA-3-methyladenine glycosylase I